MVTTLDRLRSVSFDDGLRERRWELARRSTWDDRAAAIVRTLRGV
jgi:hypothetical protein